MSTHSPVESKDEFDLRRYANLVWTHIRWISGAIVLAVVASILISTLILTPVYTATTKLLIDEAPGGDGNADYQALLASERQARTYAEMITNQPILTSAAGELSLTTPIDELSRKVSATWVTNTKLIELRVEDPDPVRASQLANTIAEVFAREVLSIQTTRYQTTKESLASQVDDLQQQLDRLNAELESLPEDSERRAQLETNLNELRQTYANVLQSYEQVRLAESQAISNIIQVEPATPPTRPTRPNVLLNAVVAAFLGGLVAASVFIIRDATTNYITESRQIEGALQTVVLAEIPHFETDENTDIYQQHDSPSMEAYRSLATTIKYSTTVDPDINLLLITSAIPQAGKTSTSVNLAALMAQSGQRILLIDGDLRRPRLHKQFGLDNQLGLINLLVQTPMSMNGYLKQTSIDGLRVITSGSLPPNPTELLVSERMRTILEQLRHHADLVIIDSPPVLSVADPLALALHVDAVLVVMRNEETPMSAAKEVFDKLRQVRANILGVVLTDVRVRPRHYYYYHYYRSLPDETDEKPKTTDKTTPGSVS
jgi:succinoglycan biosynthesis transport protein ExoP